MAEIIFNFQKREINIQCNINETMKDLCNKFATKIEKDINFLNFFYNSERINFSFTFSQQANEEDLKRKKIDISVYEILSNNQSKIHYKDIICPKCKDSILINFNNYKIALNECKNRHQFNNIFLDEFQKTQLLDYSKILCKKCSNGYLNNSKFYLCFSCGKNLCKNVNFCMIIIII